MNLLQIMRSISCERKGGKQRLILPVRTWSNGSARGYDFPGEDKDLPKAYDDDIASELTGLPDCENHMYVELIDFAGKDTDVPEDYDDGIASELTGLPDGEVESYSEAGSGNTSDHTDVGCLHDNGSLPKEFYDLSGKASTALILDWDDTLFPSTWMHEVLDQVECSIDEVLETSREVMSNLLPPLAHFLAEATARAHVFVVTLADEAWVKDLTLAVPALADLLFGSSRLKVIYARKYINKQMSEAHDRSRDFWTTVKKAAIARELKEFHSLQNAAHLKNVLSIGDSVFERDGTIAACEEFMSNRGPDDERLVVKTLKLVEKPTAEELTAQLTLVAQWLPFLIYERRSLNSQIGRCAADHWQGNIVEI